MEIQYDTDKRDETLLNRGLDFARADEVFSGEVIATKPDTRKDYGEDRFVTHGQLDGRYVVIVWTPRGDSRRIISMRNADEHEINSIQS